MTQAEIFSEDISDPIGNPKLSVVVASSYSIDGLKVNLDAIALQGKEQDVEIIVADCSRDDSLEDLIIKYPDILFLQFPEKTILPTLLGGAIAHARGEIIAITDSTCTVDDHWISAILKAHESPHPVIGGSVEVCAEKKRVDWTAYFCDYAQFMHPLKEGVTNELPGNNITFKREALKIGEAFVTNGFWKSYWCRKLQEEGLQLISNPHIIIYDQKTYQFMEFIVRRFHHGSCFAGMRVKQLSTLVRLCYMIASSVLPFIFLMRMVKTIVSKKRHIKEFILCFPLLFLAVLSWSIGEFWGYLTGQISSCARL